MSGISVDIMVSILTPIHETALPLVERAYESIRKQQFDLGRIEWVVVLHNCSEEYKRKFHQRFDSCDNARINEREAKGTGLGYAREQTLKCASGKYLFFLDGDDELTPLCIKEAVKAMEDTGSDIAAWNTWISMGRAGFGCWCDSDPKNGIAVIEKENPLVGDSLCFNGVGLWSRGYRHSFLTERGIHFADDCPNHITDPVFNLEAAVKAEKTVILPSLVGYVYYYGIGMLESDGSRASLDILELLEKYVDSYRNNELKADNLMWFFLRLGIYLSQKDSTEEQYRDYVAKAKKYAKIFDPPKMNWKYLDPMAMMLYSDVLRALKGE